jgi:hypothetical protein
VSSDGPALAETFARSERMVGRRIADEYVLVPIVKHGAQVDAIFNLNSVGRFIWERLDGKTTGEAIVASLVERYEVTRGQAEIDYREFLAKLLSVEAVHAVEGSQSR